MINTRRTWSRYTRVIPSSLPGEPDMADTHGPSPRERLPLAPAKLYTSTKQHTLAKPAVGFTCAIPPAKLPFATGEIVHASEAAHAGEAGVGSQWAILPPLLLPLIVEETKVSKVRFV